MSADIQSAASWSEFVERVKGSTSLPTAILENGAVLVGRIPHPTKIMYQHSFYPPMKEVGVYEIEDKLGRNIPSGLKNLYLVMNGMKIFSGEISISGYRENIKDELIFMLGQPFDNLTKNLYERPRWAKDDCFFFGFYKEDGALVYIDCDEIVCKSLPSSPVVIERWGSVFDFVKSEFVRLAREKHED